MYYDVTLISSMEDSLTVILSTISETLNNDKMKAFETKHKGLYCFSFPYKLSFRLQNEALENIQLFYTVKKQQIY
ncbi:CLUMA_CG013239, isoform A [Clunio marinus]|uniref:CLUMA_CG013239, isoform A n=1 Tax=Clunio marinus TaxID=568069 RepID=A0A1J1IK72_9DIPT|nr:CLUMA_CG013239, isoform A [Clunio marinus]